jgi:limonene 1,2-monooxygenase
MIASAEMFLAAAGERSKRIKLATGVVSLPFTIPSTWRNGWCSSTI